MRHKTELRKGFKVVSCVEEDYKTKLKFGSPIFSGSKEVGKIFSCSDNLAIAYLRFDRVDDQLSCNELTLKIID